MDSARGECFDRLWIHIQYSGHWWKTRRVYPGSTKCYLLKSDSSMLRKVRSLQLWHFDFCNWKKWDFEILSLSLWFWTSYKIGKLSFLFKVVYKMSLFMYANFSRFLILFTPHLHGIYMHVSFELFERLEWTIS